MAGLGRVNLLVGTNNCGKTSVLEAIQLLLVPGKAGPLWHGAVRRGETADLEQSVAIAHLVHGHRIQDGASFTIEGHNDLHAATTTLNAAFVASTDDDQQRMVAALPQSALLDDGEAVGPDAPLTMVVSWTIGDESRSLRWPLTRAGGAPYRSRELTKRELSPQRPVRFITTDGLTRGDIVDLFDGTVLTADEGIVLDALRTIEPGIERIAAIGARRDGRDGPLEGRGGLAMMVRGQRIPIGSMGDGSWRLLGIALALVRARGGVLLVDEIDTGLHYTVLEKMWRLVFETAKRLDTQVFATTHSRDCYEALAAVTQDDRHEISLQRIERDRPEAIAFSEGELRVAAARGIEVR